MKQTINRRPMHRVFEILQELGLRGFALWSTRRLRWILHWRVNPGKPLLVEHPQGFTLELADSSASLGVYLNDGFSDRHLALWLEGYLVTGMVVIDAGAHIGEYSLLCAHLAGPTGAVHSFEPDPRIYPLLLRNIDRSHMSHIRANNAAVADFEGEADFVLATDATESSMTLLPRGQAGTRKPVAVTTIDSYVSARQLPRLDVIKLDVEGAEVAALIGAERTLETLRPRLLFIECHGRKEERVVMSRLEPLGYAMELRRNVPHSHLYARLNK